MMPASCSRSCASSPTAAPRAPRLDPETPYRHWSVFEKTSPAADWMKAAARHQQNWSEDGLRDKNWVTSEQYAAAIEQARTHRLNKPALMAHELVPCEAPLPATEQREAMGFTIVADRVTKRRLRLLFWLRAEPTPPSPEIQQDLVYFSLRSNLADQDRVDALDALVNDLANLLDEYSAPPAPQTQLRRRLGDKGAALAQLAVKRHRARTKGFQHHHSLFVRGQIRTSDGVYFRGFQPKKDRRE